VQVQETCARLVNELAELLDCPSFSPLAVGVLCNRGNHIIVTHSADDIEKGLLILLEKVKRILKFKINLEINV
jgi:hypothetical protein